ncbi:MAG TPA: beta-ketoacyl synthase N-terminal-like domain-containing protein, partial [Thermoanaerobaculia bacterium]|nr:beta-ketoacyl synthase N-terminal-like domain-containing protein [Thermoanaerobaculia bacterium]
AGVFSLEQGVEIVCRRVLSLRRAEVAGGMAALSCDPDRARGLLAKLPGKAVEIAVLNHPRQTVVSGRREDLAILAPIAAAQGITLTLLKSAYPFHCSLLKAAVEPFAASLRSCKLAPPRIPVYLAMERRLYGEELDLPELLAAQLTRPLDFSSAILSLQDQGFRQFIEVGCGDMVSRLVLKNLAREAEGVSASPVVKPGEALPQGIEAIVQWTGLPSLAGGTGEPAASPYCALAQLLSEATDRLDRAALLLRRLSSPEPAAEPAEPAPEPCPQVPIAVVGMGCVLPGAADPATLWRHVLSGVSGIVDLAEIDPDLSRDFLAGSAEGEIVPDKTYTLLNGAIRHIAYDPRLAGRYDPEAFAALTRGQKLLASALVQTLSSLPDGLLTAGSGSRQCILGATADGSNEYDEALFYESVLDAVDQLELPAERRRALLARLAAIPGLSAGCSEDLSQHELYRRVTWRLLGEEARTVVVDAACSSSLYALHLGIKALRDGEADLVVAGGVFAPGPANNALFAQFRGLTPRGSRPFDAAADGVVFGDGAATVALKRLPAALAAGDPILGVLRGLGLSSDGRSAAINVPQAAGQSLAIRRAYTAGGVSPESIQVIEAHATATPVGDAVELRALSEAFAGRPPHLARIQLGSVKALIGHTGWVSGVASLIKMLQALEHRTIPPQYNFTAPAPGLELAETPFEIARVPQPWPANQAPWPRRAGINGFGFGGTNAHLVVEAFEEPYHRRLCGGLAEPPAHREISVVGVASLFPGAEELAGQLPRPAGAFVRARLSLPAGKRLLPDVTEHMDASQYLTALAAERIFAQLPVAWKQLQGETGVVIGLAGKTERGVRANERIFLDRLRRLAAGAPAAGAEDLLSALLVRLAERNLPSGPYTLSGLMPNVAASRVASLFDLKGPNLVLDTGEGSLFEALAVAAGLLAGDDCGMVLAGGVNASGRSAPGAPSAPDAEGILLLALARTETARELGLPQIARLELGRATDIPAEGEAVRATEAGSRTRGPRWRGASGAVELLTVLEQVKAGRPGSLAERRTGPGRRNLTLAPAIVPAAVPAAAEPLSSIHAYIQGTPIEAYTPVWIAEGAPAPAASLAGRRLLLVTDQPALGSRLAASEVFSAAAVRLVCPAEVAPAGAVALDLSSEAALGRTLNELDACDFDTILAATSLDPDPRSLLLRPLAGETRLLDLLFAVCRCAYPRLRLAGAGVFALCLDAFPGGRLHPSTGLWGGFLKALARELPEAVARGIYTDVSQPEVAARLLAVEMGQTSGGVEVCWRGERRETWGLAQLRDLAAGAPALLEADSVVLATGGGRGVTAVLAEELLCRFGCTVVALGRTDPTAIPEELSRMSPGELAAFEERFYREELARDRAQRISDLKRRFTSYQAVGELRGVV